MDRKRQGDLGVAHAIRYYSDMAYDVSMPFSDATRYDLIVDDRRGALVRIQVKTTGYYTRYGHPECMLKTSGGNRSWSGVAAKITPQECDRVFIYVLDIAYYEFPAAELAGKHCVVLSPSRDRWKVHTINPVPRSPFTATPV